MKISELLRKLADVVAAAETDGTPTPQPEQVAIAPNPSPDEEIIPTPDSEKHSSSSFVPPLQAKLELLKRAVDVSNVYDGDSDISRLKKNAGISVVVADEASCTDPLDS